MKRVKMIEFQKRANLDFWKKYPGSKLAPKQLKHLVLRSVIFVYGMPKEQRLSHECVTYYSTRVD